MDLFEAIDKRCSYRGDFADAPVPEEDLRKIVQGGIQAPSGRNEQTTSFVIVDRAELISEIADVLGKPFCQTAKAMIVCISDPRPVFKGMSFAAEDRAAAVENMLLAITALGYATVWLDGVLKSENRDEKIAELLGVPDHLEVSILLPVGVPAEQGKQKEKLPFEKRAWFNRFSGE
jgi:nitroreductase